MIKLLKPISIAALSALILLSGCTNSPKFDKTNQQPSSVQQSVSENMENKDGNSTDKETQQEKTVEEQKPVQIDLNQVKPNEAGKIMIVMFHNFIETYKSGDKQYTTTFDEFGKLLQTLYDKGYRLISMNDYLNNNITVPAGCIPMVFTFDDGTAGQFNLVEENGTLVANRKSAVGIMEEFNKKHPDFGLKGTFYVNLSGGTFEGKGTIEERLKYLIDEGFEIGNHTYNHIDLKKVQSSDKIQMELGANAKKFEELLPGNKMTTLALPLGHHPADNLKGYLAKGEYEGAKYENLAVLEVGWDPAQSPVSNKFNPMSTHRVRASGIVPVEADLAWWLEKLSRKDQYVSDGDPATVSIPKSLEENINKELLKDKKLVTY